MKRLPILLALLAALLLTGCGQGGTLQDSLNDALSKVEAAWPDGEEKLPSLEDILIQEPSADTPTEDPSETPAEDPSADTPTEEPSNPPTEDPTEIPTEDPSETPTEEPSTGTTAEPDGTALSEDGTYDSREDVALYIVTYGHLPGNYITKSEARALGWEGGGLERYAPGKCIGGDRFGNREGNLPGGHTYTECDIDTLGASSRGAKRIVYSEDLSVYYTGDHYATFELLYGGTGP